MGEVIGELRRIALGQFAIGGDDGAHGFFQAGIGPDIGVDQLQQTRMDRLEHQPGEVVLALEVAIHRPV